ncbi:uncharacterized protein Dyak_GE27896, isoform A [Drosophila yakuba]|uniref:Uncharacterized protein, isoform A n=1 Tax=Drosophila yakuba TaxID=7245 RepID=A0A0R1EEL0_DROYA|nr:uncharacterized protein Dyak_GE27896, isoform A [Drosophila yakuba]
MAIISRRKDLVAHCACGIPGIPANGLGSRRIEGNSRCESHSPQIDSDLASAKERRKLKRARRWR